MISIFLGSFHQFVHNMLWRTLVGISHSKIDDVFTLFPRVNLQILNLTEHIRRKTLYTKKLLHLNLRASLKMGQVLRPNLILVRVSILVEVQKPVNYKHLARPTCSHVMQPHLTNPSVELRAYS